MTTTPQAQRVIDGLLAIGLPRDTFKVQTERTRRNDHGVRYTEYGDASSYFRDRAAHATTLAAREVLAARGLTLRCIWLTHTNAWHVYVTSEYNPHGLVFYTVGDAYYRLPASEPTPLEVIGLGKPEVQA